MTAPEPPEYDDREGQVQYGLIYPFVACATKDGPYDDVSFVAGFQMGQLDRDLTGPSLVAAQAMIYTELRAQADLIAMHHGFTVSELYEGDGWSHLMFRSTLFHDLGQADDV